MTKDPLDSIANHPFSTDGPPNLDSFTEDPSEMVHVARVFRCYADYLENRARVTRHRLAGNVHLAKILEKSGVDELYAKLPEWARW